MDVRRKPPTTKGPDDWFTGDVWIDSAAKNHATDPFTVGLVHFTPGAHTAWHRHTNGQTLYVLEGEGRVQARDADVHVIRAGDVVDTEAGEWHWHGAAPDHLMTHIAVSEGVTEWGEHLTDEEYPGE